MYTHTYIHTYMDKETYRASIVCKRVLHIVSHPHLASVKYDKAHKGFPNLPKCVHVYV